MTDSERKSVYIFKEWINRRLYDLKLEYAIEHTDAEYIEIKAKIDELKNVLDLYDKYIGVQTE